MTGAGGHLASVDSSSLAAASAARPWFPALAAVDTIHPAATQTQVTQHLSAAHPLTKCSDQQCANTAI